MMHVSGNLLEVYCDVPGCNAKAHIHAALETVEAFRQKGWFVSHVDETETLCPHCNQFTTPNQEEEL